MFLDSSSQFSLTTAQNLDLWLKGSLCDELTKREIREMIQSSPEQIENGFYANLEFGTGGLRGVMGLGPNRVNSYTIQQTSRGIGEYVQGLFPEKKNSVVIGYDSRINSKKFAMTASRVFGACGLHVYLFKEIAPTPLVSFACRQLNATIAIMITASHNPSEYNGYKVYWSYGGQVLPPHDIGMMESVERVRKESNAIPMLEMDSISSIELLGQEIDQAYFLQLQKEILWKNRPKSELHIVYSPLHGTGGRLIETALHQAGFEQLSLVLPQMIPDGSFSTVQQPNPESPEALHMGIDLMLEKKADICIASDPDADRLGVVVMHNGAPVFLNGNQIAALMCEWVAKKRREEGESSKRYGIIKSCVTTPLLEAIAGRWDLTISNVLPGFKYIAEQIESWRNSSCPIEFIFGGEESYGTLAGLHARDKDAISAAVLICEISWYMKQTQQTLIDALEELYRVYGFFYEDLLNIEFLESKEGRLKMASRLFELRVTPPTVMNGMKVVSTQDLLEKKESGDTRFHLQGAFPSSNVLIFTLEDSTRVIIRPSGTEPKVKMYLFHRSEKWDSSSQAALKKKSLKLKNWLQESYS